MKLHWKRDRLAYKREHMRRQRAGLPRKQRWSNSGKTIILGVLCRWRFYP